MFLAYFRYHYKYGSPFHGGYAIHPSLIFLMNIASFVVHMGFETNDEDVDGNYANNSTPPVLLIIGMIVEMVTVIPHVFMLVKLVLMMTLIPRTMRGKQYHLILCLCLIGMVFFMVMLPLLMLRVI